jgi:hypothetical protein
MVYLILVLLAIWLILAILGIVIRGLFWLAVIGGLLFLGTAAYGAIKGKDSPRQIRP